jgi:hypothetical protein
MACVLCGPFQGCCLETTIEGTVVFYAVCSGNNGAAVFSMRSVPTIGKAVYSLYNNGRQRCYAATIEVFSLWSDPRLYNKDRTCNIMRKGL